MKKKGNQYERIESPDPTTLFSYHDLTPPTTRDVYKAYQVVRKYLPKTPLVKSQFLSEELAADVFLKREDTLPTGAFKVRGGIYLASSLPLEFREKGLLGASTGNHGQSLAYAGHLFDIPATIGVPNDANPEKVKAMEQLGAKVIHHGKDFDEAREYIEHLAAEDPYRYVHSGNEPKLIAGVGTTGLEVLHDLPEVDMVISPVGGGSGASGYCLTVGRIPDADIIGVQSEKADAAYKAWKEGHLRGQKSADTFAEGIASRVPFGLPMKIMRKRLTDMILVSDEALWDAMYRLMMEEHVLAEGAGVASVAGALKLKNKVKGKTVVLPITGRNLDPKKLKHVIQIHS